MNFSSNLKLNRVEKWWHFLMLILLLEAFKPLFSRSSDPGQETGFISWGLIYLFFFGFNFFLFFAWYRKQLTLLIGKSLIFWPFLCWSGFSLLWTRSFFETLKNVFALGLVVFYAFFIFQRFSKEKFFRFLFWTLLLTVIVSLFVIWIFPEEGMQITKELGIERGAKGVFIHKNIYGSVLVVFLLLVAELIRTEKRRSKKIGLLISGMIGLYALLRSGSLTDLLLFVGTVFLACWLKVFLKKPGFSLLLLAGLVSVFLMTSGYLVQNYWGLFEDYLKRDVTLTGRTEIWRLSWDFFKEKPFWGYGFNGFWLEKNPEVWFVNDSLRWDVPHAHNFYLDLLLNLGIPGLFCFLCIMADVLIKSFRSLVLKGENGLFYILFFTYLFLVNLTESRLLKGFNFWWFMMFILYLFLCAELKKDESCNRNNHL